jgi:hypothetical protein
MEFEEYPLLNFPELVGALLRASGDQAATVQDAALLLAGALAEAHEDPPVTDDELLTHLDEARRHVAAALLVEMLDERHFRITPRGRAVLHSHPEGIDDSVLSQFPEFRHWLTRTHAHPPAEDARARDFQRGWLAQRDGRDLTDNPFATDTAQHQAWQDGWLEAERQAAGH